MPVAAARALAHDLRVCSRSLQAEADALHSLAAWAYQFSSQVSLYPPFALLLEVRRSLSLFGGYTALLERIPGLTLVDTVVETGYTCGVAGSGRSPATSRSRVASMATNWSLMAPATVWSRRAAWRPEVPSSA